MNFELLFVYAFFQFAKQNVQLIPDLDIFIHSDSYDNKM